MLDEEWYSIALACLRTVLIYGITLLIVRLGSKRLLSKGSPFDFVVSIMLGSIMSRAMTGQTEVIPTVIVGATLLLLHWIFASLSYHTRWFGKYVKGTPILLVKDGNIQQLGMKRAQLTMRDLEQAIHLQTGERDATNIERAYLERNGRISILGKRKAAPRVLSVDVEDGVQTVRIEFLD